MRENKENNLVKIHHYQTTPPRLKPTQARLTEADGRDDCAIAPRAASGALKGFTSSQMAVDFGKTIRNSETL